MRLPPSVLACLLLLLKFCFGNCIVEVSGVLLPCKAGCLVFAGHPYSHLCIPCPFSIFGTFMSNVLAVLCACVPNASLICSWSYLSLASIPGNRQSRWPYPYLIDGEAVTQQECCTGRLGCGKVLVLDLHLAHIATLVSQHWEVLDYGRKQISPVKSKLAKLTCLCKIKTEGR